MKTIVAMLLLLPATASSLADDCAPVSATEIRCEIEFFAPAEGHRDHWVWLGADFWRMERTCDAGMAWSKVDRSGVVVQELWTACFLPTAKVSFVNTTGEDQVGTATLSFRAPE